jgi:hypothetical protein
MQSPRFAHASKVFAAAIDYSDLDTRKLLTVAKESDQAIENYRKDILGRKKNADDRIAQNLDIAIASQRNIDAFSTRILAKERALEELIAERKASIQEDYDQLRSEEASKGWAMERVAEMTKKNVVHDRILKEVDCVLSMHHDKKVLANIKLQQVRHLLRLPSVESCQTLSVKMAKFTLNRLLRLGYVCNPSFPQDTDNKLDATSAPLAVLIGRITFYLRFTNKDGTIILADTGRPKAASNKCEREEEEDEDEEEEEEEADVGADMQLAQQLRAQLAALEERIKSPPAKKIRRN